MVKMTKASAGSVSPIIVFLIPNRFEQSPDGTAEVAAPMASMQLIQEASSVEMWNGGGNVVTVPSSCGRTGDDQANAAPIVIDPMQAGIKQES